MCTIYGVVIFQIQSPKNTLKLAAMKRMRDAGWTAVTGNEKKKKTNEKIFAWTVDIQSECATNVSCYKKKKEKKKYSGYTKII